MGRQLTDNMVANLKPKAARYNYADPAMPSHYVRVAPTGTKSFACVTRENGKQRWITLGSTDTLTVAEARDKARAAIKAVKDGVPAATSFKAVAEEWLTRHVQAKGLRTESAIRRTLALYVFPAWGSRNFGSIKRTDVTKLLDAIEDNAGAPSATKVLAHVSSICTWYQGRNDDYVSPCVSAMRRTSTTQRARKRVWTDAEIRTAWKLAPSHGTFGALVQTLLLTGQRLAKVTEMKWADIDANGLWTIPTEAREKGNAGALLLPPMALDIINARPKLAGNPYVFAGRTTGPLKNTFVGKSRFDAEAAFDAWTLHDLRKTARSLMSRAGVRPDIAERVLGHAINGVEGVYDRHAYTEECGAALVKLADLVTEIVAA